MTPPDPKAPERMREALDLLAASGDGQVGRASARICSLVKRVAADAKGLEERVRLDGWDAVDAAFMAMHVRDLVEAQAQLAERRERLRDLHSVVEFAYLAAG